MMIFNFLKYLNNYLYYTAFDIALQVENATGHVTVDKESREGIIGEDIIISMNVHFTGQYIGLCVIIY